MASLRNRSYRQAHISTKLAMQGSVSVTELSRDLETSEVTIRKDLTAMEERGLLKRVSGGAVSVRENEEEN